MPDETVALGTVQQERDAWVKAIDKLCSEWKRKSKMFMEQKSFRQVSITEDTEDNDTDLESSGEFGAGSITYPPADNKNVDPPLSDGDNLSAQQTHPPADHTKPIPKPRRRNSPQIIPPQDSSLPSPSSTSPTSPPYSLRAILQPPPAVPESPAQEAGPPPRSIPAPPPLPLNLNSKKACTKVFHWDLIGPDKVKLSPFITSH